MSNSIVNQALEESKEHKARALVFTLGMVAVALLVLAAVMFYKGYDTARTQAEAGTSLAEQIQAACDDPTKRTADIESLCDNADNVVKNGEVAGIKGERGDPGFPGVPGPPPSASQVANAVALFCASDRCNGVDGQSASPDQVARAVTIYCNNRGQCRGSDGQNGDPGPTGPAPTDSQIAQAVSDYCASRNECRGAQGDQGPTGVVDITVDCTTPDGKEISEIQASYNQADRRITLTCTYRDQDSTTAPPDPVVVEQ